jgi:hypothetical protein
MDSSAEGEGEFAQPLSLKPLPFLLASLCIWS